jgi:hypothetical protein
MLDLLSNDDEDKKPQFLEHPETTENNAQDTEEDN